MTDQIHTTSRTRVPRCAVLVCMLLGSLNTWTNVAHSNPPTTTDAEIVQPFVGESTIVIAKVDLAQVALPDLDALFEWPSDEVKAQYKQAYDLVQTQLSRARTLVGNRPVYAAIDVPVSPARRPVFVFVRNPEAGPSADLLSFLREEKQLQPETFGDYLVVGDSPTADLPRLLAGLSPAPREELAPALQAVERFPVQILLLPPAYLRRVMRELPFELPPHLGGGPSSLFSEGVKWAALGIDPAQLRTRLVVESFSDSGAQELANLIPKMLAAMLDAAPQALRQQIPGELLPLLTNAFQPEVTGRRVTIALDGLDENSATFRVLSQLLQVWQAKAREQEEMQRFRIILLAMHNYHDVHGTFPPADKHRGPNGQPLLSWRVYLLPLLDQQELYSQFRLDEPWDSDHNKPLLEKMPDVYASRASVLSPAVVVQPGYTTVQAPVGEKTVFGQNKPTRIQSITDGTSNTVVLLEVKPELAVPWTAPADYRFDPQHPATGILVRADERWLCAFADGSTHLLPSRLPAETLLRLFEMNDGQVIDFAKLPE